MTASTSRIIPKQEKSFSEWKTATWTNYLAYRDNPNTYKIVIRVLGMSTLTANAIFALKIYNPNTTEFDIN